MFEVKSADGKVSLSFDDSISRLVAGNLEVGGNDFSSVVAQSNAAGLSLNATGTSWGGNTFWPGEPSGAHTVLLSDTEDFFLVSEVGGLALHVNQDNLAAFFGPVKPLVAAVVNLPSPIESGMGARAFVSDSLVDLSVGIGSIVVGGGSKRVPVYSDGLNWLIG